MMFTKNKKLKRNRRFKHFITFTLPLLLILTGVVLGGVWYLSRWQPMIIRPIPSGASILGTFIEQSTLTHIQDLLKKEHIGYQSVTTGTDSTFLIKLKEEQEVVLTDRKNVSSQVSSLQVILLRLTMEGKHFKRLDLRFDKPVIILND